ncbi:MAG: hypothetical protein ACYS0E_21695 [Planctomycetota bacterium]
MRALLLSAVLLVGCAPSRSYTFDEPGPPPSRNVEDLRREREQASAFIAELLRDLAGFIPGVGIY